MEDLNGDYFDVVSKNKKITKPDWLELTSDFEEAYDAMENSNENVFITGVAGSGKSTLMKYFLSNTSKRCVVLSPTGMGAINLQPIKASTIHRFFRFPPKPLIDSNIPIIDARYRNQYKEIDCIIIDEISMVSSLMMEAIHKFYQMNFNDDTPFGNIQMIFCGDLAQLTPVIPTDAERNYISTHFGGDYFFDSKTLKKVGFKTVKLNKVFRQKDDLFINYLNKIRVGEITQKEIDEINEICCDNKLPEKEAIILTTTNAIAANINSIKISELPGENIVLRGDMTGNFNMKNCPVDEEIVLRKGCKVMVRINDQEGNYVNGSIGTFIDYNAYNDEVIVEIKGERYTLGRYKFEQSSYKFNENNKSMEAVSDASFSQIPISIAYSFTIHKSQGLTFEYFKINMGRGAFSPGQLYVALSRGTDIRKISLINPISITDIIMDNRLSKYIESIEN